jgi:histidine ammonia-lyase
MKSFLLGEDWLSTRTLTEIVHSDLKLEISEKAWAKVDQFRGLVEEKLASGQVIYGINTGFGFLSNVHISSDQLETLQLNLIRSHASGVGEPLEKPLAKGLLALRIHSFALGHSGVSRECMQSLLDMFNRDIIPVIPVKGSVGASGDLAPLAHLALALIGEGDVFYKGKITSAQTAFKAEGISPYKPKAKEGLSLINGTQFMTAIAGFATEEAQNLAISADIISSLSLDGLKGSLGPFDPRIQMIRAHAGQGEVARFIRSLFEGQDQIMDSHVNCNKVQDPYSFRCIPQVHGASRDFIQNSAIIVERELNSITDNPLVFENGDVISGGNFHGQYVAMAMDVLGIAVCELGSISERRIEKLTNPALSGLPPFTIQDSGLNSGFMIPHVVAAALVSENKIYAHPAVVDSIPTSADKEDHVSMGPIAARKAREIIRNVERVLAIEAIIACQAIDLHKPLKPAPKLEKVYNRIRAVSKFLDTDRSMSKEIETVAALIRSGAIIESIAD